MGSSFTGPRSPRSIVSEKPETLRVSAVFLGKSPTPILGMTKNKDSVMIRERAARPAVAIKKYGLSIFLPISPCAKDFSSHSFLRLNIVSVHMPMRIYSAMTNRNEIFIVETDAASS